MVVCAPNTIRLRMCKLGFDGIGSIAHFIEPGAARGASAMWAVLGCPTELLERLPQGCVGHWALAIIAVRENELRVSRDRMHGLEKFDRLSR